MEDKINEIIKWFDFEKVRKTMIALGWKWYGSGEYPSIGELVLTAQKHLKYVCDKEEDWVISSGGFEATKRNGMLTLKFIVEDLDVDLEEEELDG